MRNDLHSHIHCNCERGELLTVSLGPLDMDSKHEGGDVVNSPTPYRMLISPLFDLLLPAMSNGMQSLQI